MRIDIGKAIISLAPNSVWSFEEDDLSSLEWFSEDIERPSDEAILTELARLQAEYEATKYQRLRAAEYPDFREYLDAVVKGDDAQMQSYIEACLAVKAKYPKPLED